MKKMAGNLQPLVNNQRIVKDDGTPTDYFIRWAQQKQIDIGAGITAEQALEIITQYLADHELQPGSGIQITPSGNLSDTPTIAAEVQAILDQITDVRGSILFRGAAGWEALAPGLSGQFLKTMGAGADPVWAAGGGGGGGAPTITEGTGPEGSPSGSAYATKGQILQSNRALTLAMVKIPITTSATYMLTVAFLDSSNVITSIEYQNSPVAVLAGRFLTSEPALAIPSGQRIAILATRTGEGATASCGVQFPLESGNNLYALNFIGTSRYASVSPSVSDNIFYGAGSNVAMTLVTSVT